MSIDDKNRLDIMVRTPEGEIGLVMTAFQDWSADPGLLQKLSEKLSVYVGYSKTKDFKKEHGKDPVKIILSTEYDPTPPVLGLLDEVSEATGIPIEVIKTPSFGNPFQ